MTASGAMGNAHRLVGYLASFSSASVFYLVWLAVQSRTSASHVTVLFQIGFALFFWLFGGVAAALILMAFPWYLAVIWHDRPQRSGLMYFSFIGSATTTVIGCATSSLAPKPLFIEDQTFLEGFMIAIQRQGVCLMFTGLVFGLTFWFVSERLRHSRSIEAT
jgi:hypothetical protein